MAKPALHDPVVRASIERRINELTKETRGRWGKMSVDQMLWHCNQVISTALGDVPLQKFSLPLPAFAIKFMVLNMPWTKGAPTAPGFIAANEYDFDVEKRRALELIARFASRSLDSPWEKHPAFGPMTGTEYSRLQAKHFNHHLTQFGV